MKKVLIFALLMSLISFASAATILGGSALLTTSYANQLESWLGEGNITITNIYVPVL